MWIAAAPQPPIVSFHINEGVGYSPLAIVYGSTLGGHVPLSVASGWPVWGVPRAYS